jgi:hypothetical protein
MRAARRERIVRRGNWHLQSAQSRPMIESRRLLTDFLVNWLKRVTGVWLLVPGHLHSAPAEQLGDRRSACLAQQGPQR